LKDDEMDKEQFDTIMKKLNEISMAILSLTRIEIKYDYNNDKTADAICTCPLHREGQYTAGWWCPIHGHRF